MDATRNSEDAEGHFLEHDDTEGFRPGGLAGWRGRCEEEPEGHSFFLTVSVL